MQFVAFFFFGPRVILPSARSAESDSSLKIAFIAPSLKNRKNRHFLFDCLTFSTV